MPFFAFLVSLKSYASGQYRVFILCFLILYGYTFIPIPNSDATRYIDYFNKFSAYNISDFKYIILNTYSAESANPDIYAPLLLFITTRFSDDYRIFFTFQSFIYFAIALSLWKTIWELTVRNKSGYRMLFFIGTVFVLNISAGLNGVRFPLGFMVFSLGALKYLLTNNKRFLLLAMLSVFVHFSLVYPFLFLIMFSVLQRSRNHDIVMVILIIVLSASSVMSLFISSNMSLLGPGFQNKLGAFTSEGFMESRGTHIQNWNWYIQFNLYSPTYLIIGAIILSWMGRFKLKNDPISKKLILFSILLLIQCILSGNILDPITNDRYFQLMNLFGLITLSYLAYLNQTSVMLKTISYIYAPILLLRVLIFIRTDLDTVSPVLIFGNIFLNFIYKVNISIYELLF